MKTKILILASIFSLILNNTVIATEALVGMTTTITNPTITIDVVNDVHFGELRDEEGSNSFCSLSGAGNIIPCEVLSGTPTTGLITINGLANASIQVYGTTETSNGVTFTPKFGDASHTSLGSDNLSLNVEGDGSVDVKIMGLLRYDSDDITSGTLININTTVTVVYN